MRSTKNKTYKQLCISLGWIPLLLMVVMLTEQVRAQNDPVYKEYVSVHLGRNQYIAGEVLMMKAYCFSNLANPEDFLSKALYLELIDLNKESILSRVLKIEDNAASTILEIPDTLPSGSYNLKLYTNWMKNFGESYFATEPVYIYNQYDAEAEQKLQEEQILIDPQVYISGGQLIRNVPAEIMIYCPSSQKAGLQGSLVEQYSGRILQRFSINAWGEARLKFIPQQNTLYAFSLGDSISGFETFPLPPAEFSGYALTIDSVTVTGLRVSLISANRPDEKVVLKAIADGKTMKIQELDNVKNATGLWFKWPEGDIGRLDLILESVSGEKLTQQTLLHRSKRISSNNEFPSRSEVAVELDLTGISLAKDASLSVSVHRTEPDEEKHCFGTFAHNPLGDMCYSVMPRLREPAGNGGNRVVYPYLVEDMGIDYTGTLENPVNNSPLSGIEVVLAVKDTIGLVLASNTDKSGQFSILLNEDGNREAYISTYANGIPVSGNHRIYLDQKFYYKAKKGGDRVLFEQPSDTGFVQHVKDEAQRVLIQRAFENLWVKDESSKKDTSYLIKRFYGEPTLTVYPDDFFFLPNFEEIAREIVPRIRYKHNQRECELIVVHIENNTRSVNPIILLDGNLITNHCDLYDLDSDDIQRIEVQSGLKVSGNLLYEGLVAIYTTDKYKKENEKKNGRRTYPVPGYMNNATVYSLRTMNKLSENPDFKNQLYWNPFLECNEQGKADIEFFTSDEEGTYVIDVMGMNPDGLPVHLQKIIHVNAD